MTLIVNIIGAGKLGKTIARLLVDNKLVKIAGVHNQNAESSLTAIKFIGEGKYFSDIKSLPLADITFITVPDDHICATSIKISRDGNIKPGSIFIHCSGVLTSEIISAVKVKEALIASIHPMKSFSDPALSVENYAGTYCAMEGDAEALRILEPLFKSIGSHTYKIAKDKKSLYHAAGVFASNYLVTLSQQALNCFREAGVEDQMAFNIVMSLMQGTLTNIEKLRSPSEALTGPIKRGDGSTIKSHLSALTDAKQRAIYSILGQATISLTSHNLETKTQLESELLVTI